jgi:hypothetical protein
VGLENFDPLLASHRLVMALKTDRELRERFERDQDSVLQQFGLTEAEVSAIRARDFRALYELGLHPYYLSQLSRLIFGTAAESKGASDAARALVESFQRSRT